MNKTTGLRIWLFPLANAVVFVLSSCGVTMVTSTPTPDWHPMPTYIYDVLPSDVSEYLHYTPSEAFNFHLEFDYPGYW